MWTAGDWRPLGWLWEHGMATPHFTDSQIGRAAQIAAEYGMPVSINSSGTVLFVVYGAEVRRVDAGHGWASRMRDAMKELRPALEKFAEPHNPRHPAGHAG